MQIRPSAPSTLARRPLATAAAPQARAAAAKPVTNAPDLLRFREAVAAIERSLGREKALKAGTDPSGLRLQPNYESIFMPQPTGQAKGTVVLYHGFTAGPWQYKELAEQFHKAGYHVYAPRIVGHGLMTADGKVTSQEVPRAHQRQQYETYIDERFAEAAALGAPVYMVGLSGGGNLALRTAEKHPEVKRVVALAPYVGPGNAVRYGTWLLSWANKLTFGLVSRVLNWVPYGKNDLPDPANLMPHTKGTFGQAWSIRSIGYNLKSIPAQVQFMTTHGDFLSGDKPVQKLIERSGGDEKNGWYHFKAEEKVPHAMVSRDQNHAPGTVDTINRVTFDFIEKGTQADRWPG